MRSPMVLCPIEDNKHHIVPNVLDIINSLLCSEVAFNQTRILLVDTHLLTVVVGLEDYV